MHGMAPAPRHSRCQPQRRGRAREGAEGVVDAGRPERERPIQTPSGAARARIIWRCRASCPGCRSVGRRGPQPAVVQVDQRRPAGVRRGWPARNMSVMALTCQRATTTPPNEPSGRCAAARHLHVPLAQVRMHRDAADEGSFWSGRVAAHSGNSRCLRRWCRRLRAPWIADRPCLSASRCRAEVGQGDGAVAPGLQVELRRIALPMRRPGCAASGPARELLVDLFLERQPGRRYWS